MKLPFYEIKHILIKSTSTDLSILVVPVSGRCGGANPSSHVTVPESRSLFRRFSPNPVE
ncbi:hypothetical protein LINPERPRIM_LOCUS25945 [Linum perenne]